MSEPLQSRLSADFLRLKCSPSSFFSGGYIFLKGPSLAILSISRAFKIPQALPSGVKVTLMEKVERKAP